MAQGSTNRFNSGDDGVAAQTIVGTEALRIVQSLLHHSTMETTERYLGLGAERLKRDQLLRAASLLVPYRSEPSWRPPSVDDETRAETRGRFREARGRRGDRGVATVVVERFSR